MEFFDRHFLGNSLLTWLVAVCVAAAAWTLLPLLKARSSALARSAHRNPAGFELLLRLVNGTTQVFGWAVALHLAERLLSLPQAVARGSTLIVLVIAWIQAGRWALIACDFFLERQRARRVATDAAFAGSVAVIRFVALVAIWSLVLLLALDNMGVDVTALVAGLGIGGVAVALAVQAILKDLLGSLAIALDRPFIVGDNITLGQLSGKVEHIGVKSTRLRSASGEQITVSNADLVQARVRNFGGIEERRAVMIFSVAYETPPVLVKRVSEIVKQVIEAQPRVRFDRCHFRDFGSSGLTFEAVFHVLDSQMAALLSAQQAISSALRDELAREAIAFAYPVQRVEYERWRAISPLS